MVERIRKIAANWQLSPTALADHIGISRPVISHIFSGRNRPSLEVVQKIASHFPEVNRNWLLTGEGEMIRNQNAPAVLPKHAEPDVKDEAKHLGITGEIGVVENVQTTADPEPVLPVEKSVGKRIKKVLLFYTDNTFEEFNP